jgi:hypothetical protein
MTKLAAALLLVASTASAQTVVATDGVVRDRTPREFDARLGMLLGGADVGDADGFSAGISGALGYRIGDVTLRGLFDYYRVGDSAGVVGLAIFSEKGAVWTPAELHMRDTANPFPSRGYATPPR